MWVAIRGTESLSDSGPDASEDDVSVYNSLAAADGITGDARVVVTSLFVSVVRSAVTFRNCATC